MRRFIIGVAIAVLLIASISLVFYATSEPKTTQIEIDGVTLNVELATTPAAQQQGLSGRDSMAENHGMLFVFNQEAEWSFWMHEMRFSLDIIWFNASRQVVFIQEDLPPCTPTACPVYTPPVNTLYVLEVNAGFAKTNGVRLGDSFNFV